MLYYIVIVLYYYNLIGLPSYMRSVVDRNVVMQCIPESAKAVKFIVRLLYTTRIVFRNLLLFPVLSHIHPVHSFVRHYLKSSLHVGLPCPSTHLILSDFPYCAPVEWSCKAHNKLHVLLGFQIENLGENSDTFFLTTCISAPLLATSPPHSLPPHFLVRR